MGENILKPCSVCGEDIDVSRFFNTQDDADLVEVSHPNEVVDGIGLVDCLGNPVDS